MANVFFKRSESKKVAISATAGSSVAAELRTNENDHVYVLVRVTQRLRTLRSADQRALVPESGERRDVLPLISIPFVRPTTGSA